VKLPEHAAGVREFSAESRDSETAQVEAEGKPMASDDLQPWKQPGAVRRDCDPHRGHRMRVLGMALVTLATLYIVIEPVLYVATRARGRRPPVWIVWISSGSALPPLFLGLIVWVLAAQDLTRIRSGGMAREGKLLTESARGLGQVAVFLSLSSTCTWKLAWLASWLGW
jgi:hypothetical protein